MIQLAIFVGLGLIALAAVGLVVTRLYVRATKDTAFVRTGLGGEKVVLNGGALVIGLVHETMRVGMNTVGLEVQRTQADSLITKDSMLVDVHAQFFVRVAPNVEAISKAAQTLGRRTLDPTALKQFIEGKFVDALRNVAARMTLDELNQNRQEFVRAVQETCQHDLAANGLELESVSLTGLVQTDKKFFNPDNALHAQGLTELTRRTSDRAIVRNQIETETRVKTETKNAETDKQSFTIAQEREFARLEQDKAVKNRAAQQAAEVAAIEATREADIAAANAAGQQRAQQANIKAEQETRTKRIESEQAVKLAEQQRDIRVAEASRDQSRAQAEAETARAEVVKASQGVITAEQTAVAERQKAVQLVQASQEAEQQAIGVRVRAEAERDAATARAEAAERTARGEAAATTIKAEAQRVTYEVEAEGKRLVIQAENTRSTTVMDFQQRTLLMQQLPDIIRESVKPLEAIDRISIADFGGMLPGRAGGGGAEQPVEGAAGGSLADQMVGAALRYRAQGPLVDSLMQELNMNLQSGPNGMAVAAAGPPAPLRLDPEAAAAAKGKGKPAPAAAE